jgi:predicted AAA+ superfamily ATPase
MESRSTHLDRLRRRLADFPVVALLGPRQVRKTTLARQLAAAWDGPSTLFDLKDPDRLARLAYPAFALRPLRGLVELDVIQWRSDLFPLRRVLADRPDRPARFLILGSTSPELLRHASESLAGRIGFHELEGFGLDEIDAGAIDTRWLRGGFLRALLAATMRRFWTMLAHCHGQACNGSELARAMCVTDETVSRWLDVLEGIFLVSRLRPWQANIGNREIKAPKVYIADTGLLHSLLGIASHDALLAHPKCGASWEGLIVLE